MALAPCLQAQTPSAPAKIVGTVVDSLNGRYLVGADIVIEGRGEAISTDSLGRFHVDSLPAGTYRVGVFHPLLDTLGITLLTQPFRVGPDSTSVVLVGVPSAATLVRRSCASQSGRYGASAVIGRVVDPETLEPVRKAEVSVAWTDVSFSKDEGLRRSPRLMRASTDAAGAFKICGLPNSLKATLQARHGSAKTAELPIELGDRPVELLARTLLLSVVDPGKKTGSAAVSGVVVLEGSPTNAGSRVELVGTGIVAMTNEKGEFTIRNLPLGSKVLAVRHLGFDAKTVAVDLSPHDEQRVTVNLPKFVPTMDRVVVTGRRSETLAKVGFTERQKKGFGYYIGPDRLDALHPVFLTDILRLVPGLRVERTGRGDVVSAAHATGNGCIQWYLDNTPYMEVRPGDINGFVVGDEVMAVEVYQGLAPVEYTRGGVSCATIVLWTRYKIRG
ncbi:MAG: carboxypeptidase regulatory-like domain-containing protein [Gemmatimonadaceae bacterium]